MARYTFILSLLVILFSSAEPKVSVDRHDFLSKKKLHFSALRAIVEEVGPFEIESIFHGDHSSRADENPLSFIRRLVFPKIPTAFSDRVGEQCKNDSIQYLKSVLLYSDLEALKMYDAAGVDAPGLFSATSHPMGHFDQCISARTESFQGKYCTAFYTFLPNSSFYPNTTIRSGLSDSQLDTKSYLSLVQLLGLLGKPLEPPIFFGVDYYLIFPYLSSVALCLPSTCNGTDVQNAFAELVGSYSLPLGNDALLTVTYAGDDYCYVEIDKAPDFNGGDIAVIWVLSVIGFLVVASTLYEGLGGYFLGEPLLKSNLAREKTYVRYLCVFSLINNSKKLLSTKANEGSLGCIHGIRFFSMTWVIMGHTWLTFHIYNNMYPDGLLGRVHNWFFQTIFNATPSVDSFFMLSGLLASYLLFVQLDKAKGKLNPLMLYLHRYLRLTPVYAIILGFNATLIVYLSSGPNWYSVEGAAKACRKAWWHHPLYINNLVTRGLDEQCMMEAWYIAADMQLFLIVPLLVYPIWRWKIWGILWLTLVTVGSLVANIVFFATEDVLPTSIPSRTDGDTAAFQDAYSKPWYRAPPYLVGIYAGFLLYLVKKNNVKVPKVLMAVGWACAIAIGCSVVYGMTPYVTVEDEIPKAVTVMYGSFHRFAWAAAVAWVVFACVNGYGGYVNDFLSWKAFIPLGRLTYCVYLIHVNLLNVYASQQRSPFYYTDLNTIYGYLATLLMSLGIAFSAAVTVETPFLLLEKMLFSQKLPRETKPEK